MQAIQSNRSELVRRSEIRIAFAAGLLVLVSACGGGGGESSPAIPPPAVQPINLVDDSATAFWNFPTTIDVLANDTPGAAGLVLATASKPAHGQAAIVAGKLVYTPDPGYFGADSVIYTAQQVGGATASAKLSLTVEAAFQLKGVVNDGPIANAAVTVEVGKASFTTVANAQGAYSIAVRSADGTDFISVRASGSGAQSQVKLLSRLGTLAALTVRVSASNELTPAELAATRVSHVSTALAALATQANGGIAATTQPAFEEAQKAVSTPALVDMAAAIKLVVDQGVALPPGATDTLAMVSNPVVFSSFLQSQATVNVVALNATRQAVIDELPAAPLGRIAAGGPQTLVFFSGQGPAIMAGVQVVTFNSDGSASVVGDLGARAARWTVVDSVLRVVLSEPFHDVAYANDGFASVLQVDTREFGFRLVAGTVASGLMQQVTSASQTFLEGPKVGTTEVVTRTDLPAALVRVMDLGNRLPLAQGEFTLGSRLAGVSVTTPLVRRRPYPFTLTVGSGPDFTQQLLRFDGVGVATLADSSATPWSVADNWMLLGARKYARLRVNAATGEERWLGIDYVAGVAARAMEMPVVRAGSAPTIALSAFARNWRSAYLSSIPGSDQRFKLFQDGSAQQLGLFDGVPSVLLLQWRLSAAGEPILSRTLSSGLLRERLWIPLDYKAGRLWVLESVRDTGTDGTAIEALAPSVSLFTDEGPALP